ncbi:MAG TPA: hypothetical protein VHZ26_08990 [Caulobacteraceae bacterium]|jgi:hypothetical protein|nr:hypothetical protein [Caulobacteraceae bacterium]
MPLAASEAALIAAPLLPGERLLHGRVWIFDHELRNDFLAAQAMWRALWEPPRLASLSDAALTGLFYRTLRYDTMVSRDGGSMEPFLVTIATERAARKAAAAGAPAAEPRAA